MRKYVANEKMRAENVGLKVTDDVMLYNQETEDVHVLNSTAYEIFEFLKTPYTEAQIVTEMKKRFGIDDDSIDNDIKELLDDFFEKGIIIET